MSYGGYQQQPPSYGAPRPGEYGAAPTAPYAGVGKRFVAALLDGLLVCVGMLPGWVVIIIVMVGAAAESSGRPGSQPSDAASAAIGLGVVAGYGLLLVGYLIVWLYNIYLLGRDGATLGKRWMKIKVLDPQGQPLGFGKAFLREIVKGIVGGIPCIGWVLLLWPLWDAEKQGLYDKLFSTHVYDA